MSTLVPGYDNQLVVGADGEHGTLDQRVFSLHTGRVLLPM